MDDFAARFADLLENFALKVRSLTVDRAAKAITILSLALPLSVLALMALVFLFMTLHGALAVPLTDAGAYGVLAGLFAAGGALAWRKRISEPEDQA